MSEANLSTVEEIIEGKRNQVKRSVPFYSWRKRKQLLEHFDRTVALYEGTVGIGVVAEKIKSSATGIVSSFEKTIETSNILADERLVDLVKNSYESDRAHRVISLVTSTKRRVEEETTINTLMNCLETYQKTEDFDYVTSAIKNSWNFGDESLTLAAINLINSSIDKYERIRYNIIMTVDYSGQQLKNKDNYKKILDLLESCENESIMPFSNFVKDNLIYVKDEEVQEIMLLNLEKYLNWKFQHTPIVEQVTDMFSKIKAFHKRDDSLSLGNKFEIDVKELQETTNILSHYDENKARLTKVINFVGKIIHENHSLELTNEITKTLENYSSLPSFKFGYVVDLIGHGLGNVFGTMEDYSYLGKTLSLPEVVKTIRKCSDNWDTLARVSEAILYTAAVCPEEETVSRVAKMLRNGVDIVKKTAITEAERIISLARNYRKYPKGFQAATKVLESYLSSHNFDIALKAIDREFRNFSDVLGDGSFSKDDVINQGGTSLEKSVKKLEALASPKVKEFLDERLDWPNRSNLGSFISGCYSDGVSLDHITQVAENLKPYLNVEDCEIILNPLEEALCVSNGSTFWDKVSVQNPEQKLENVCNNLKNPNVIKYFKDLPKVLETVAKPLGLMIAWGDSDDLDNVLNLLNLYENNSSKIQKDISKPLAKKIYESVKKDLGFDGVSKAIKILTRPKIVERINGNKEFYKWRIDAVKVISLSACETEDQELVDIISDYVHNDPIVDTSNVFSGRLIEILNKEIGLEKKLELTKTVAKYFASLEYEDNCGYLGSAVYNTAMSSNDISLTKKVIKLVDQYKEKKGGKLVAKVISEGAINGISDLTSKLNYLSLPEFKEVVDLYQDKLNNVVELAVGSLTKLVENLCFFGDPTRDDTSLIKHLAGILTKYHSHTNNQKILEIYSHFDTSLRHKDILLELSSFVSNCPDIYKMDVDNFKIYFNNIRSYFVDKNFRDSLTSQNINNLVTTYHLITSTCDSWDRESRDQALKGFGNVLNSKVQTGETIADKRKILDEWSTNVYRMILDNAIDLNYFNEVNAA